MDAGLPKVKAAILELYYEHGAIKHEQIHAETEIFGPLLSAGFERSDIQRGIAELHDEKIIISGHDIPPMDGTRKDVDPDTMVCRIIEEEAKKYLKEKYGI